MSIFNTQADTYQNSFANPMNPANMNPGWGIDPNLLTPSYTAGYRPQYNGPAPYNQYGRVGFFAGVNHMANPFAPEARWGNPIDNNASSIEGVSSRPFDSVVWAGQRVVAPALAYGMAFNKLGFGARGGSPAYAFGRSVGRGFGTGFVNAFGSGASNSMLGRGVIGASGAMTGAFAGLAIPYAVGTAALEAGQRAIFNPYINNRMAARDLRQNFSGVTFGDSTGNAVTGGGLGYNESTRIASDITKSGIKDMTFSTAEYTQIADMGARAGLMDNVNSGQISKRVKDISEQIKLIMSIARDPSIKGAIEELSKLQMAGASLSGGGMSVAAGAYRQIGQYASIAGRSVQNVMNTVGAQGQYLYQANGMTPYLGQMAAANVMSSFGAAERIGMLSPAQLARMGGVEGATQASLTGQINAGQSLYNKMALYNSYMNGAGGNGTQGFGSNQTVSGVVSRFGTDFAKDPLGAYGSTMLYGRQMLGKQMEERGSLVAEDQAVSILKSLAAPRNKNGQYSASQMMPVLKMLGMSEDEAIAYINQRSAESDPNVANQKIRGLTRFNEEQKRSMISQNFLYGGALGGTVREGFKLGRSLTGGIAGMVTNFTEDISNVGDWTQKGSDWLQFGATLTGSGMEVKDYDEFLSRGNNAGQTIELIGRRSSNEISGTVRDLHNFVNSDVLTQADSGRVRDRINALAKSGNKEAMAFLSAKGKDAKRAALGDLLSKHRDKLGSLAGQITNTARNSKNFDQFIDDIEGFGTVKETLENTGNVSGFERALRTSVNSTSKADGSFSEDLTSLQGIGQATDIMMNEDINAGTLYKHIDDPKYAELKKLLGGKTGVDAYNAINQIWRKSAKEGTTMLGSTAFTKGIRTTGDSAKDRQAMIDLIKSNGNMALTKGISSAEDISDSDLRGLQSKDSDFLKERNRIMDILKTNRVDYATAQNTMNSLDNSKSVKDFEGAVDKFSGAVDKMNGDGKSPATTGSNASMFDKFANVMGRRNTQRENGSPR
ncbi:hypothetical protein D3C87_459990 [compost metagenome]